MLRTLALRPVTLYGEGDRHFVVNSMRQAKAAGGSLSRMGPTTARFSAAYVGEFGFYLNDVHADVSFPCSDL